MCLAAMLAAGTSLKAQEVTITLSPGWTWIGYLGTEPQDFATALGSFTPEVGDVIKSQWGYASYGSNGQWRGSISQFYPGYGYHYWSNRQIPVTVTIGTPLPQLSVTTTEPTDITLHSAISGGSITTDAYVFAKGICWATHANPTPMEDDHSENGGGNESFTAEMTDLTPNTMYYVRAYVVTDYGLTYGNELTFTTAPLPSYTVTVSSNPTGGGTATGGGTYEQGQGCTLTATANDGYTFTNWTENGEVVSTNATYSFTVNADRTLVANFIQGGSGGDHAYVDLGLPSGLLWATCNVGADNPEDYGDYFAWGETQPKDTYNWSTYQYYDGSNVTKYTGSDGLTTLLPEDDAATANWGSGWRMPTRAEWQELYQNTTHTWTTQNGVNGRLFTASNGNSLFLPAAGYRGSSSLFLAGSYGYYWSSSLYSGGPGSAWCFYFYSGDYNMDYGNRYYGLSVRAVRVGSQN